MASKRKRRDQGPEDASRAVEDCLKRICSEKELDYWRPFLKDLVSNNAIPLELLEVVPVPARDGLRTRFDQVFAACMSLAFPSYRKTTLRALLGPSEDVRDVKIWRVVLPDRFQLAHVLIRATTFQEAFALACDYACRASLRMWRKVPADLTVRVMFMSEKALRRHLDLRWANRVHKRKELQLEGREFTPRQVNGARLAALGPKADPWWSVAKYSERRDLEAVRQASGRTRRSEVEGESFKRR